MRKSQRLYPVLFSEANEEIPALFWMSPVPPPVPVPSVPAMPEGHAPLPRWSAGHATRAQGLIQAPRSLVLMLAPLLLLLGTSCASLEPQRRTLTVVSPGERATVVLVYPGLHVQAAGVLLTGEAVAAGAALHCDTTPVLTLTSAVEETAPGKDGAVAHTTTIQGTAQCGGGR